MNFELSDEQKDVQKAAREFAQGEFDPDLAIELDQAGQFPESIWKKASKLGFIGMHFPEEFGGQGLGFFENVLVMEAFCRIDSGIGNALGIVDVGSDIILEFGSPAQKKALLLPLTKGERCMSAAFEESEDGIGTSTYVERKGSRYLIHGEKRSVLNASLADTFIVLLKEPKEGWITLTVEKKDGVEVNPDKRMGLRMIPLGSLRFKDVPIPVESRVGREGEGTIQANRFRQAMGLRNTAQALGMAQGAFDRALQYAKQREQFGKKLSQFQAIRHKLADMAVGVEVARQITYKAAIDYDQGKVDPVLLAVTQLEAGRKLTWIVDEAVQIFGGYGYIAEQDIEHYYRDAWTIVAELGREEDLRDSVAAKVIGS